MTDTLSEREKELVEAVRDVLARFELIGSSAPVVSNYGPWKFAPRTLREYEKRLSDALKAYDPKPEPVPVIPEWKEFVNIIARDPSVAGVALKDPDFLRIDEAQYNAIRKATARMPD